jgi:hypothetical protein
MWSTINRLQLAARLHLAMRYKHGVGIDMRLLLGHRRYAKEALELCYESGDYSLSELASHFEDLTAEEDAKAHMAVAAQATRLELAELLPVPSKKGRIGRRQGEKPAPSSPDTRLIPAPVVRH